VRAQVIDEVPVIALGFFLERGPRPLRAYSSIRFWRTGGIAWIVVAWDFAFDIPGKPENAYAGQGRPTMRRAQSFLEISISPLPL
jgi:hypothetical protein